MYSFSISSFISSQQISLLITFVCLLTGSLVVVVNLDIALEIQLSFFSADLVLCAPVIAPPTNKGPESEMRGRLFPRQLAPRLRLHLSQGYQRTTIKFNSFSTKPNWTKLNLEFNDNFVIIHGNRNK